MSTNTLSNKLINLESIFDYQENHWVSYTSKNIPANPSKRVHVEINLFGHYRVFIGYHNEPETILYQGTNTECMRRAYDGVTDKYKDME